MMYDSSACMLRMMTPGGRSSFCARAATSMPLSFGMPMSTISRSGPMLLAQPHGFEAVGGFGDDRQAGLLEQAAQPAPHDAVVVSQQHAQAAPPSSGAGSGSRIVSVVPWPVAPRMRHRAAAAP